MRMAGTQLMKYGRRLFSLSRMTFPPFHSAREWESQMGRVKLGWVGLENNIGIYFHGHLRALI